IFQVITRTVSRMGLLCALTGLSCDDALAAPAGITTNRQAGHTLDHPKRFYPTARPLAQRCGFAKRQDPSESAQGAAIPEPIFKRQPRHPGVAHYLLYDTPALAEKGIDAAKRYSGIAPSAPHAVRGRGASADCRLARDRYRGRDRIRVRNRGRSNHWSRIRPCGIIRLVR